MTLGLDDLFCEPMDQFWHLEYLDNYKCCSDSGLSVLTSQECLDSPGVNSWSSWSTWSGCERLITVSGVENVRRRYRLSRSGQDCLSVLLEAETCDEDKRRTGGCVDREIIQSLPRCWIFILHNIKFFYFSTDLIGRKYKLCLSDNLLLNNIT